MADPKSNPARVGEPGQAWLALARRLAWRYYPLVFVAYALVAATWVTNEGIVRREQRPWFLVLAGIAALFLVVGDRSRELLASEGCWPGSTPTSDFGAP